VSDQQENPSPGAMNREGSEVFLFINLSIDSGYYGVNHGIACLVPFVRKHSYTAVVRTA